VPLPRCAALPSGTLVPVTGRFVTRREYRDWASPGLADLDNSRAQQRQAITPASYPHRSAMSDCATLAL